MELQESHPPEYPSRSHRTSLPFTSPLHAVSLRLLMQIAEDQSPEHNPTAEQLGINLAGRLMTIRLIEQGRQLLAEVPDPGEPGEYKAFRV